jgi:hypothetical protein
MLNVLLHKLIAKESIGDIWKLAVVEKKEGSSVIFSKGMYDKQVGFSY